jgi:hypothetical protein
MAEALSSPPSPSPSPCHDEFTCIMFLAVHGTVSLRVDESTLQSAQHKERGGHDDDVGDTLEQSLGPPLHITALPLGAIGRGDGRGRGHGASVTEVVSPTALGYSVFGSENSQFPRYIEAFIHMVESKSTCLTGSEIVRFFNSFDDKMYSFFNSKFNKELQELQNRFLARVDQAKVPEFDFTKNFVTFARDELSKCDVNTRMQVNRKSAGLYWTAHNDSCIAEKLYSPGTHANQCCLYFPGVTDELHDLLALKINALKPGSKNPWLVGAPALCSDVSIESSSDKKLVLTITFDTGNRGFVKNKLWKGITLNMFFRQIKQYLKYMFDGVEGFNLDVLMSRTCVIDTACANFSVPVPGQHVSIIGFDNAARGTGEGAAGASPASMLLDIHNDPRSVMGWWEHTINLSSGTGAGDAAAYTHFRHRLLIPRDLVSYVPSGLVCVDTIKSVEPTTDDMSRVVSVKYTYHDGRQVTIARELPPSSGAAAGAAAGGLSDSMGGVCDPESQTDNISDSDLGGGGRKPLHTTRRVRSLRNKSKTKRSNKIRGFRRRGVRRTRRKRTHRTLRR